MLKLAQGVRAWKQRVTSTPSSYELSETGGPCRAVPRHTSPTTERVEAVSTAERLSPAGIRGKCQVIRLSVTGVYVG